METNREGVFDYLIDIRFERDEFREKLDEARTQLYKTLTLDPEPPVIPSVEPRLREQTQESTLASGISIGAYRSPKYPDLPIFTDSKDPEFEDWSLRIIDKLTANADYFTTKLSKAIYVISRTGGRNNYFNTPDSVLEALRSIYEDLDKIENTTRAYQALRQRAGQLFTKFYSEFSRLGSIIGLPKSQLRFDLRNKINLSLKEALALNPQEFTSIYAL
ncbi:MAG: hypothetical protein Q9167_008039 [Letrouitia subvulpina]